MIGRRQLAVASPISARALSSAFVRSFGADADLTARARELVARAYDGREAVLTDSGTSALVLALRLGAPNGGTVGFPGYSCVDLAAAARFAGVRARLYDIDPVSLSPDLDSVARLLRRGVDAIVVAHLFGFPADVPGVRALADAAGVPVIEDAAQGAGGELAGARLGALGELSVVSFGRGKGLCAGGGGALIGRDAHWAERLRSILLKGETRGLGAWGKTVAQWILGRPSLYAIPSMVPGLRLGEMVYHPATEPSGMTQTSSLLLSSALALEAEDLETRRRNAAAIEAEARSASHIALSDAIPGGRPGYLRYPLRDRSGARRPAPALGIVRPYPRQALDEPEWRPALIAEEPHTPGAHELARSIFTLPAHRFVTETDMRQLGRWLRTE